jgi:hypothetical protein
VRNWIRPALSLPYLLIAAAVCGFCVELVRPPDAAHATAVFGTIGSMLTLGGTLAMQRSQSRDEERRRREERRFRREHLKQLAELRRKAAPDEARIIDDLAQGDGDG